ncbi:amino acid ABC transporter substrate-binding protein [Thalassospira sp. HF15]|uniref:substrate-binding periplasmic protein n=1 Tax=Thalassospira sp. HF15 TaxID=2722755 RepID=UPI0014307A8F|nr:transporter substrate-binding domain-containing protein [Thalassospira sp. HF15]NIY75355.1 amino acid ABC transporter substrate-binding protein [Thalassospira sp. HF15]
MRRLKAWCLVITAFLLGEGWFGNDVAARTLVVAINDAPPYRIVSDTPDGQSYEGIYVDVVREAARRAGLDLVFEVVPFKRALFLMESGDADLMLGPNRTDERLKYMYYFGAALPSEPKVIYTAPMDANVIEIEDLEHKLIGVLRGANYGWQLEEARDIRFVEAVDYETLFRMLDLGRIDALIAPELLAIQHIQKFGPFRIKKSDLVLQGQPSFIAISRKSDFFLDRSFTALEQHLVEMRQDGTFDDIYGRYAHTD